jgi:C-terminal processing protease CtpA/Prc
MKRITTNFVLSVFIVIAFVVAFTACVSSKQVDYTFNNKKNATELKADLVLLKKILEANHPSLYWYTPKDSIDFYFNNIINSITDSLTEVEFRNKVSSAVSKIRCGHTSVRFSKDYTKLQEKNRYPQFPLYFKVWDDSLVVLLNIQSKDTVLKRGTIVTAINGKTNRQILNGIFDVISTDGYSDNFKNQVISNNFPTWYKSVYGLDSNYTIEYINNEGNKAITVIKNFTSIKDASKRRDTTIKSTKVSAVFVAKPTRKQKRKNNLLAKRSLQIDTSINTAYMRISTFSNGRLRTFFRRSFKTIKEKNIENVVIDLRENGGGSVEMSTKLAKYLADKPFKCGDTVEAINRKFTYKNYIKDWWIYWVPMNLFAHKEADGNIHFRRYEKHYYKPQTKNHFNGNVYLLQGGLSFSATTMFIATLKGQHNVTVAGEETGGGYYGNSAMHLPTIVLPNSKLRVVLPMYRLVMDKNRPKGRGVIPDVSIPPSSLAIKKGIDIKLQKLRELILQRRKNTK